MLEEGGTNHVIGDLDTDVIKRVGVHVQCPDCRQTVGMTMTAGAGAAEPGDRPPGRQDHAAHRGQLQPGRGGPPGHRDGGRPAPASRTLVMRVTLP